MLLPFVSAAFVDPGNTAAPLAWARHCTCGDELWMLFFADGNMVFHVYDASGVRSPEEAGKILQSRVGIYLAE